MSELFEFLPVSKEDMESRGWWWYDFLIVTGDAYVDHPSFGPTVIARVLEAEGYRVAILAQPDWHSADAFLAMGRPRLGAMLCSGNLDSMVAHYTAAKKPRSEDFYSPGKKAGLRPDHAVIVYANRVREAAGLRRCCAVSHITTIGTTRCAAVRWPTPEPTFLSMEWENTPRARSRGG